MITASQVVSANRYVFTVGFLLAGVQVPTGAVQGTVAAFEDIAGAEFQPAGAAYDVIVGMDIMARGNLHFDFAGRFSFAW